MSNSVAQWLEQLGLGEYADLFAENDIDVDLLSELDQETLKDMGVASAGHRLRILKAVKAGPSVGSTDEKRVPASSANHDSRPPRTEAERRQLTIMFCDLAGSTELSERLDPEEMRDVNRAYQDACKSAIERYDGYVARYMGDGVLAYFGYPQAHEDDAERAIHAALAVVESVSNLKSPSNTTLSVRVGIATGPVVVGDLIGEGASQESAVVGDTPNLAARLQGLAQPNSVVVALGTHELAEGQFVYEDLGRHALKGISEPVRSWRVVEAATAESRFEATHRSGYTAMVGRDNEIGLLMERWQHAKEGDGQVVLLSGEAGIGKSRITEALRERTSVDDPVRLRYQCTPFHTNSALYPVIQRLHQTAALSVEDSNDLKLEKLRKLVEGSSPDPDGMVALLAPLLSISIEGHYPALAMTPEQQKAATLEALVEQMDGMSKRQPVLLIFEDAHWADPTSIELLELTVERTQTLRAMVVITFRPEFTPPWTSYSHVTALTLNRFTRSLVTDLVAKLTVDRMIPPHILEQIVEKTDGVPLFVEELTKTIVESDQRDGVSVPATLHDSLMARLDRLGAVKEVAQTAAAIGREFDFDLLAIVSPLSMAELHDALDQLVDAELVFRRARSRQEAFIFKHALVQDAAYESLLKSTRRNLHRRIGEALASRFPEVVAAQPELLGHHFTEGDMIEEAVAAWRRAGVLATERSANKEAIAYYQKSLEILDKLPESTERHKSELALQTAIAGPLITIKGYGAEETGRAFTRAQELSELVGASDDMFPVMYGQWVYSLSWLRYAESAGVAKRFLNLAQHKGDSGPILMGHRITGISMFLGGNAEDGQTQLCKVSELYLSDEHAPLRLKFGQDPLAAALAFSSLCLWELGYPEQSLAALDRAIAHARELDHVNTIAYTEAFGATVLYQLLANPAALKESVASVTSLAEEHGLAMWRTLISSVDGWLAARYDRNPEGLVQMRESLDTLKGIFPFWMPYRLAMLAEAHKACGEYEGGLAAIDESLSLAEKVGERCFHGEYHRIKAELLLGAGRGIDEAEALLLEGLDCARARKAKLPELRIGVTLARLWGDNGRRREASDLVSPIYDSFTEGFETPDLAAANELLSQLQ